jgi:N-6 DNA Methylase
VPRRFWAVPFKFGNRDVDLPPSHRTAHPGAKLRPVPEPAGVDYPVVITPGSVFFTAGTDRRSSGTHYTPKSLTEQIVQYTLEPLVYVGPADGLPRKQWTLRTAKELLDLKICDMACGSGAFLVQVCRYMAARLLEVWEAVQFPNPGTLRVTPEGLPSTGLSGELLIPDEPVERQTCALRIVAQRWVYGVDKNRLAAEMAKLSLWLLTLAKDKPFEFLDHPIRCGDSLVGIHYLDQLRRFNLDGKGEDNRLFLHFLDNRSEEAMFLRR